VHLIRKELPGYYFEHICKSFSLLERQVPVAVEVLKEVPVTVERVVYKEVLVPVENGVPVEGGGVTLWGEKGTVAQEVGERSTAFSETVQPAQYERRSSVSEHRSNVSEQAPPSEFMTRGHIRSPQVRLLPILAYTYSISLTDGRRHHSLIPHMFLLMMLWCVSVDRFFFSCLRSLLHCSTSAARRFTRLCCLHSTRTG
jgi:hypothetical protein